MNEAQSNEVGLQFVDVGDANSVVQCAESCKTVDVRRDVCDLLCRV